VYYHRKYTKRGTQLRKSLLDRRLARTCVPKFPFSNVMELSSALINAFCIRGTSPSTDGAKPEAQDTPQTNSETGIRAKRAQKSKPAHNQTPHRQHYGLLLRARDIIFLFAHTPLIPDFNLEKEQDELRQIERTLVTKKGCKTNSERYIIVATKEVEACKRALQKLKSSEPLPTAVQPFLVQLSPKKVEWTGRDLNPGPPRCQRGDHARLIYPPIVVFPETLPTDWL
jgi:hypothetical protein